jgi:hypothetical protein
MTDDTSPNSGGGTPESTGSHDETYWEEPAPQSGSGREWVSQLQTMIEQVATQAAPVAREVGAKAAELAALAGEKAGPAAHRAAQITTEAGLKLAERSRTFAAEIRREQAARGEGGASGTASSDAASSSTSASTDRDEPPTAGVG